MPAHVTEVQCHSISDHKNSYNYMCSGTYYLIIGALSLPRSAEVARYGIIFPLHYKHEWTLSYTYRILICLIYESLEQRKRNKLKHNIFHVVNSGFAATNPRPAQPSLLASLWRGDPSPLRRVSSSLRRTPAIAQIFFVLVHFSRNQTKNKGKLIYLYRKTSPKWVLTSSKPNMEIN